MQADYLAYPMTQGERLPLICRTILVMRQPCRILDGSAEGLTRPQAADVNDALIVYVKQTDESGLHGISFTAKSEPALLGREDELRRPTAA